MDKQWYDELHEKYKHLFWTYEGEVFERSYYAAGQILRGIEVSESWKWIVVKFLESIEWLTENRRYMPNPDYNELVQAEENNRPFIEGPKVEIKIFQIKEKFGDLRIYVDGYPKRIHGDIEYQIGKATARAELTCYGCGKITNELSKTRGWISFICPECMEKKNVKLVDCH